MGSYWAIICVHLKEKPIQNWNKVMNGNIIQGYLCDECDKIPNRNDIPISQLEPASIETINQLRLIS